MTRNLSSISRYCRYRGDVGVTDQALVYVTTPSGTTRLNPICCPRLSSQARVSRVVKRELRDRYTGPPKDITKELGYLGDMPRGT
jgi:hypothetical protein